MTEIPPQQAGKDQAVPVIVLTGPSMAGKTTVAAALAATADIDRWSVAEQWESELDEVTADRVASLEMLAELERARRPLLVESTVLPLLLPPHNLAFIARLSAGLPVRVDRLRAVRPELSALEARAELRRNDHAAQVRARPAWGVHLESIGATQWRSDLVVQCPDRNYCREPQVCAAITTDLVIAANEVYRGYMAGGPGGPAAVRRLSELISAHPNRIRRCVPLLTDTGAEFTAARWRNRLLIELEQRRVRRRHEVPEQ